MGLLARGISTRWQVPVSLFAYAGVVAMIPGSYAFRAASGLLTLAQQGAATPVALALETASLAVMVVNLTVATSVGLALPSLLGGAKRAGSA